MPTIITTIEDLKKVVKVNASLPWESIEPYINEAESCLGEYFSQTFLDSLENGDAFWAMAKQAVGPLAMALAIDEMSVNVGDAGITVINEREGKRSPASDSKIAAAKASLQQRAYANLSRLIHFVILKGTYDTSTCELFEELRQLLCNTMHSVMKRINIKNDYLTLFSLLPTLRNVQQQLTKVVGQELMSEMLDRTQALDVDKLTLRSLCKDYIVFQTAYLQTSMETRRQRAQADTKVEWRALVRPLYFDLTDGGNYYAEEAKTALSDIESEVARLNGEEGEDGDSRPGPTRRRHTASF